MNLPQNIGKLETPLSEMSDSQRKTSDLVKNFKMPVDISQILSTADTSSTSAAFKGGIFGL